MEGVCSIGEPSDSSHSNEVVKESSSIGEPSDSSHSNEVKKESSSIGEPSNSSHSNEVKKESSSIGEPSDSSHSNEVEKESSSIGEPSDSSHSNEVKKESSSIGEPSDSSHSNEVVKESSSGGECSNSSESNEAEVSNVITKQMLLEESRLEKQALKEEQKLKLKVMKEKQAKELEEQCYKRLNLLLNRSCIYAQFMAEKVKKEDVKEAKKQTREKKNVNKKRENDTIFSPSKRQKTMIDAYKNEANETRDVALSIESSEVIEQPRLLTGGTMHPYQVEGYKWLTVLYKNGVNGILADEMGLGKTIQCIALVAYLIDMGVCGPFFICGPLSTVANWHAEFKRFTPDIPVMVYHGSKAERSVLRQKFLKKVKTNGLNCYPVVLTSYQIALIDAKLFRNVLWGLLAIDEAHRIKNFQCKLVTSLKSINASNRLLLTGTPLQNDLSELWSLLNFILPEIFDDLKVFESWFDINRLSQRDGTSDIIAKEIEKQIVTKIHQILTPFLLRRTKTEVDLKLPGKKEVLVHAHLTELQRKYYTAALDENIEDLIRGTAQEKLGEINLNIGRTKRDVAQTDFKSIYKMYNDTSFVENNTLNPIKISPLPIQKREDPAAEITLNMRNTMMILRRICNHPYLVSYPLNAQGEYKMDEELITSSGKLMVLDQLLTELYKRGHKVVLFTQFVIMIEILKDFCYLRNHKYNLLHGIMSLEERTEQLKEFKESPDSFLFLVSTKAGGLGINLAEADTVIIYDSDWNPQGDLQAQDRCHRIGQSKPVVVYRIIIPNTIDEKIYERAQAKRKLEKVIIKTGRFNSARTAPEEDSISVEELRELLNSCENKVLPASEIERLLDRSDIK